MGEMHECSNCHKMLSARKFPHTMSSYNKAAPDRQSMCSVCLPWDGPKQREMLASGELTRWMPKSADELKTVLDEMKRPKVELPLHQVAAASTKVFRHSNKQQMIKDRCLSDAEQYSALEAYLRWADEQRKPV